MDEAPQFYKGMSAEEQALLPKGERMFLAEQDRTMDEPGEKIHTVSVACDITASQAQDLLMGCNWEVKRAVMLVEDARQRARDLASGEVATLRAWDCTEDGVTEPCGKCPACKNGLAAQPTGEEDRCSARHPVTYEHPCPAGCYLLEGHEGYHRAWTQKTGEFSWSGQDAE